MTVAALDQPLTNAKTLSGQTSWSPKIPFNLFPAALIEITTEFHWKAATATHTEALVKAEPMLTSGPASSLSADMCEYLEYEAKRRGVSTDTVLAEEMAARKLFDEEPFTADELEALAATSNPHPRLLEGDEECPF
jgi:hypothetical protein